MAVDLDEVLKELGQFGRYQINTYLLISLPIFFTVISGTSYVFTAGDMDYRCLVPQCENSSDPTELDPSWLHFTEPPRHRTGDSKCLQYVPLNTSICEPEAFSNRTQRCTQWVFDPNESTIASEWNLTCEENQWKLTLVGTINSIGYFVTTPVAGYMSDRFGRRTILLTAILLASISGLIRSLSVNYTMFIVWEFLDMALGGSIYETAFVLGMELVGPQRRVLGGAIISAYNGLAEVFLGLIAWAVPDWRLMLQIIYGPALLLLSYYWILPESVRWLISHGRMEEAEEILLKAARTNGVVLSNNYKSLIESFSTENAKDVSCLIDHEKTLMPTLKFQSPEKSIPDSFEVLQVDKNDEKPPEKPPTTAGVLIQVFHSRTLLFRLFVCCFIWCTNMFVFYGLSLNSVTIAGNKYVNFILVCLIELPAYFATYCTMDRLGRKFTLCFSLAVCGCCCFSCIFVGASVVPLMAAKFSITVAFTSMYVYTAEMFPTPLRHSLLGTCSMFGGLGITVAPQTPLLIRYMEILPVLLFGGMSLASSLFGLFLPETIGTKLPDTVKESEDIGKKIHSIT